MTFTVRPAGDGGWHAFVSAPRLLLVAPHDDAFVATAWARISADDGFRSALEHLTSRGLAATPHFVLIEWRTGETARVILRGDIAITVTDASGEQQLTATGVSTWVERTLPGVTAIALSVPGATALGSALLPLDRGVSLVAGIASDGASVAERPPELPAALVTIEPSSALEPDVEATVRDAPDAAVPEVGAPESAPPEAGDTVFRTLGGAAETAPTAVDDTLHDGETVVLSAAARTRSRRRPTPESAAPPASPAPAAPAQSAPPVQPAAPKIILVLSSGAREPLLQPILMGRSPSLSKVSAGQIPRLIAIGSIDQDISRNHAQFSLEGGTVVITDLHSRNGTTITLPGKSAQKLRPGEPTSVIVGTVVDFGGGVTVRVEEEA